MIYALGAVTLEATVVRKKLFNYSMKEALANGHTPRNVF